MATKASSASNKQPKKQKKPSVICPTCDEPIIDGTTKSPGHDSIECEGACTAWLHRGYAGLSKAAFQTATASPDPFLCPHCRLVAQSSELLALKSAVNTLSIELSSLKVVVEDLMANINTAYVPNPTDFPSLAHTPVLPPSSLGNHVPVDPLANKSHVHSTKHDQHHHSSDRKYNIVLFLGVQDSFL